MESAAVLIGWMVFVAYIGGMSLSIIALALLLVIRVRQHKVIAPGATAPQLITKDVMFGRVANAAAAILAIGVTIPMMKWIPSPLLAPVIPSIVVVYLLRRALLFPKSSFERKLGLAAALSWVPAVAEYCIFWDALRATGGYIPLTEVIFLIYSPVLATLTAWTLSRPTNR